MRVAIDKAGRIVVPKQVREALGVKPDTELVLFMDEAGFRVELAGRSGRGTETGGDGLPVLSHVGTTHITVDEVRSLRYGPLP
jgi:AbrB family looped-hinge helix DNA binding protein